MGRAWTIADSIGAAIVMAIGCALACACRNHPAMLPAWAPWDFSWVEFLPAAFGVWWYCRGLARALRERRPSGLRQTAFLAGVLVIYAVLQTRFDYMAQHMFFLSRIQHMTTHHLGPFLIALAWPDEMLRRGMPPAICRLAAHPALRRSMDLVQQPVVAATLFAGLVFLWLIPPVHFRAMLDVRWYAVMNWSMVADGLLFWVLVLDPRPSPPARLSFGVRLLLVMSVQLPQIMVGALIALSSEDLYPFYDLCGRLFPGIEPHLDQEAGGFIIYYPAGMMSALAAMILFRKLWRAGVQSALEQPLGQAVPTPSTSL
jgi:putative membrane protein